MEKEIGKLKKENQNHALKRKIERIQLYIPEAKKLLISRAMPAELVHELFASLPLENAFDLLAKMPNGLLARNIRKILKSIEMAMKANKWNAADCGQKMEISEGGLVVKHSGPDTWNTVRAQLSIPKFNLNAYKAKFSYFEVEIVAKYYLWGIRIGFCTQQFLLEDNLLGDVQNSIEIWHKEGMYIDGKHNNFGNNSGYFQAGEVIGIGNWHCPFPCKFDDEMLCNMQWKFSGMGRIVSKICRTPTFPCSLNAPSKRFNPRKFWHRTVALQSLRNCWNAELRCGNGKQRKGRIE